MPVMKKGQREEIRDYKGVSIMSSLYKIYTATLAKRLRENVEGKGLVPPIKRVLKKMKTLNNM